MDRGRSRSIAIVTPAARGSSSGNRVTALRWAKRLRELGHRVRVDERFRGGSPDVLVALHATKSAESIEACRANSPSTSIVVALTGTDVYGDRADSDVARRSLASAQRIVALQELALDVVPARERARVRVIHQSAPPA